MRANRDRQAERQRRAEEAARVAERAGIARELHDVVTHHVTAMVVQAEAARYLTDQPEQAEASLKAIAGTGRQALTELRHLLGVLDPGHRSPSAAGADRAPLRGRIGDLVGQVRAAGQPVELHEQGVAREEPGAAELAAYRVVQEGLTNALKYAPGVQTAVHVRHSADVIDVDVVNDAPAGAARITRGSGRGLAGLRERVVVLGGELSAGPRPDGGYTVHASIPTGRRR
jgi:signal transduction histidine kinase